MKPQYTHQVLRARLEKQIRPDPRPRPSLEQLRENQWVPEFEQYMRNRLIVGAIRYETFDEKSNNNTYDILGSIKERLERYEKSKNKECLVDCANLLMIEFKCPTIPGTHFSPTDDTHHVQKISQ